MSATAQPQAAVPTFDQDFWSDEILLDPYPAYQALRDAGPAVWMSRHGAWAITRHDSIRDALLNAEVFSSAKGCSMNDFANTATAGLMLCSDDPAHREMRLVFAKPLMPGALASLKPRFMALAEARIDDLVARGTFDAVADLAHHLPATIVTELVGLSDEGKANMLRWAAALFDAHGPDTHARTLAGLGVAQETHAYLERLQREELAPDGWGAALFDAADRGADQPWASEIHAHGLSRPGPGHDDQRHERRDLAVGPQPRPMGEAARAARIDPAGHR